MRLRKPGFVVIHEDANAAPGKIFGVSGLLTSGERKDSLEIPLLRPTVEEETVYAMLHIDDGDGMFDEIRDKPIFDPITGDPMMMIVLISKDAFEPDAVNL